MPVTTTTDPFAFTPRSSKDLAIKAWNLMGGELQWSALDPLVEMLGVVDVELLIAELVSIREYQKREDERRKN